YAVRTLERRGKYLLADLSSGEVLVMHLGMSGSFRVERGRGRRTQTRDAPDPADRYDPAGESVRHDHVIFQMSSGVRITFNDPRRFGSMDLILRDDLLSRKALGSLGPEPLSTGFDGAVLARACRGKKTSLKAALLDQRVVAGLGNIYVCEALYRARLSPRRRASTIASRTGAPRAAAVRLATAVKDVLRDAIGHRAGKRFRVYDREGERCRTPRCAGRIRRITQSGRSTFWCPVCQM
ncbi:MAG: DNA-formamidopyrimidine glycosylase family protein, partial [Vicinamibacterales bacterium]